MKKKFKTHFLCNFCGSCVKSNLFCFNEQNLLLCKNCNLIYFDKQRIDFENLYNEEYFFSKDNSNTANYADYQYQRKTILKDFSFAYRFIRNNIQSKREKLLEIGPGFGFFSEYLPNTIVYDAVEISKEAIQHIVKKNIKVYEGDFFKIKLKGKYDFIVAFDVIEHQIYLKEFLKKIYSTLKPNGIFIFTTPDYSSLLNRIFAGNAPTIQPLYHNYYFNQKWFKKNLPLMGFKIKFMKTVHITYLTIGQIFLMGSFALPFIKRFPINKLVRKIGVENKVIPFIRFGGIECIIQKK